VAIGLRVRFWFFAQLVTNRVLNWVCLASCMGTRSYCRCSVLKIVKECLLKRGNPEAPASNKHLFGCIASLASAVGPHLLREYNEMLGLLLAGAFNEDVTAALAWL